MNKALKNLIAPIAVLGVLTLPSLAHADKDKKDKQDKGDNGSHNSIKTVNERQERQRDRIHDGERSGQLTRHESAGLRNREAQIRAEEKRDRRSGGDFSRSEKHRIQNQLNDLGKEIGRQKHDDQDKDRHRDRDYYGDDYFYGSGGHRYSGTYYSPGYYPGGYYPDGYYPGSDYPYAPDRRHPNGRYPGGYYPSKTWPAPINSRQNWQEVGHQERHELLPLSETSVLRDRQARVRALEAQLRDPNNRLTPAERYGLQRELNELRHDITIQKSESRSRFQITKR